MKKINIRFVGFFIAAALFYVAAIIGFTRQPPNSMSAFWLCIGSLFLCLGSTSKKAKQDNDNQENKN